MAYDTGNPIGSSDPRDLRDNSENIDVMSNTTSLTTWTDRLGNNRKTLFGITSEIDAELAAFQSIIEINTQTVDAYTLVIGDATRAGKIVEMNYATANTLTIPPDSEVYMSIGSVIGVRQMGAGQTTIAAGSGVTIRNPHGTLKLNSQYAMVMLNKRAANEWCVEGNFSEA